MQSTRAPSLRARLAARLVSAIGIKRRLQKMADLDHDPEQMGRLLEKMRRADRPKPPRRLIRKWRHEVIDVAGCPLHLLTHRSRTNPRVVLYLHGGGFMFGPFGTEWVAMHRVGRAAPCDIGLLVYPKAPDHQATEIIDVAQEAYQLLTERYGADETVLIGSSAGGSLSMAVMFAERDAGRPLPAGAILLSPGVDMTLRDDVGDLAASDVLVPLDHVRSAGRLYAGSLGADDPRVSPLFGDLSGLPPLHVFVGSREILLPSIKAFAQRARDAGTETHLIAGEGQQHTWPLAPIPEGRRALHRIAEIVRGS